MLTGTVPQNFPRSGNLLSQAGPAALAATQPHFGKETMLWAFQPFSCWPPFHTIPSAVPPHSALAHSSMNMPPAFSLWLHPLAAWFIFSTSSPSSSSKLNNPHRWLVPSELFKNTDNKVGSRRSCQSLRLLLLWWLKMICHLP